MFLFDVEKIVVQYWATISVECQLNHSSICINQQSLNKDEEVHGNKNDVSSFLRQMISSIQPSAASKNHHTISSNICS